MPVLQHVRDDPQVEMRIGDRQRQRARRLRSDIELADRLRLNLRGRAGEMDRIERVALAEVLEYFRVLLAQRLDHRRHMSRGLHPADADL